MGSEPTALDEKFLIEPKQGSEDGNRIEADLNWKRIIKRARLQIAACLYVDKPQSFTDRSHKVRAAAQ